jgi:hypothetical protein
MSKKKGILYHRSNVKELRERSDWNELTEDEKKKLGRSEVYGLGWFETKSKQSFERYWEGEIVNGVPHGSGTYHATSDGATFVGISKNGKRHEGIFTYNDGDKYIGDWKTNEEGNHTFWNGTRYDKDGNIIKKYVNGKEIKQ